MQNKINPQLNQLLNRIKSSNIQSQFRVSNIKRQNEYRLQSLSLKKRKIKCSLDRQMSLKDKNDNNYYNNDNNGSCEKLKKQVNNQP